MLRYVLCRDTWSVYCFDLADVEVKTYDERKVKNSRRPGTRTRHPTQFLFLKYVPTASASGTPCASTCGPRIPARSPWSCPLHRLRTSSWTAPLRGGPMGGVHAQEPGQARQTAAGSVCPIVSPHRLETPSSRQTHVPDFCSGWRME